MENCQHKDKDMELVHAGSGDKRIGTLDHKEWQIIK
jgi:hypothetical protein